MRNRTDGQALVEYLLLAFGFVWLLFLVDSVGRRPLRTWMVEVMSERLERVHAELRRPVP